MYATRWQDPYDPHISQQSPVSPGLGLIGTASFPPLPVESVPPHLFGYDIGTGYHIRGCCPMAGYGKHSSTFVMLKLLQRARFFARQLFLLEKWMDIGYAGFSGGRITITGVYSQRQCTLGNPSCNCSPGQILSWPATASKIPQHGTEPKLPHGTYTLLARICFRFTHASPGTFLPTVKWFSTGQVELIGAHTSDVPFFS